MSAASPTGVASDYYSIDRTQKFLWVFHEGIQRRWQFKLGYVLMNTLICAVLLSGVVTRVTFGAQRWVLALEDMCPQCGLVTGSTVSTCYMLITFAAALAVQVHFPYFRFTLHMLYPLAIVTALCCLVPLTYSGMLLAGQFRSDMDTSWHDAISTNWTDAICDIQQTLECNGWERPCNVTGAPLPPAMVSDDPCSLLRLCTLELGVDSCQEPIQDAARSLGKRGIAFHSWVLFLLKFTLTAATAWGVWYRRALDSVGIVSDNLRPLTDDVPLRTDYFFLK
jgi:hypothetical protein